MRLARSERRYLRVRQILTEYGLPRDRLYTALRTGELPSINVGSDNKRSYLIQRTDLEQWLAQLVTGVA